MSERVIHPKRVLPAGPVRRSRRDCLTTAASWAALALLVFALVILSADGSDHPTVDSGGHPTLLVGQR